MKKRIITVLTLLLCLMPFSGKAQDNVLPVEAERLLDAEKPVVKKILFIGDSMTGWLAERLEAYGKQNGFEVATVIWDGSTIKKWGTNSKLKSIVEGQKPDAVFVSLGMNDLFETNPEARCKSSLDAIKDVAGDAQIIWVGPPSWPGKKRGDVMIQWLGEQLGEGHFFDSSYLELPRQSKTNPHPTREGMMKWMDQVVGWIESEGAIALPGYDKPTGQQMARGKSYVYKRMKET
ncbi:MAG: SGNH/GDSL hydrolase family protein, partial [Muribaculaceae bacterium]|nr:SGNH/GDSL hydrolase family protein [Muribaculaceae bacterium]